MFKKEKLYELYEESEEKTMKEKIKEAADKVENFCDDHFSTILIGEATAMMVGALLLVKATIDCLPKQN